jgi:hypothetical protein
MRATLLAAAAAGCAAGRVEPTGDGPSSAAFCDALDIMLVVDNSSMMGGYQNNLSTNAQALIDALDGTHLPYRVGITTASRAYTYFYSTPFGPSKVETMGDSGRLLQVASCGMTTWWIDGGAADRAAQLACAAKLGTAGPAAQMPLGALRDAFEARIADNANFGFHRGDALLGAIVVTDQDDCSYHDSVTLTSSQNLCVDLLEPVDSYISYLDNFAGGHDRWAATIIANTGSAACTTSLGTANPAGRLATFAGDLGAQGASASICADDLGGGLTQAVAQLAALCHPSK